MMTQSDNRDEPREDARIGTTPPTPDPPGDHHRVRAVVDALERRADAERVPLGHLVEACGTASFVPALMVPALLVLSPLSGIPFFSSFCGISIAIISFQMLFKRKHLHLPGFVVRREVSGKKLRNALQRIRGAADFIDFHTHADRLRPLVGHGGRVVPQVLCVLAGALMPLLEIVPFSSSILGAAVLSLSVGLLTRDGLFVLIGAAIMSAVGLVPFFVLRA